jgi:hypothetical protein
MIRCFAQRKYTPVSATAEVKDWDAGSSLGNRPRADSPSLEAGCTTELDYTEDLRGRPAWQEVLAHPRKGLSLAAPKLDRNHALSGDDLRDFVNGELFPYLQKFKLKAGSPNTIEYKIGEIFGAAWTATLLLAILMVLEMLESVQGITLTPMIVNLFGFWFLEIPFAYWLAIPVGLHPKGVFFSIVIAEARLPRPVSCPSEWALEAPTDLVAEYCSSKSVVVEVPARPWRFLACRCELRLNCPG